MQIGCGEQKKDVIWDHLGYTAKQNIEECQKREKKEIAQYDIQYVVSAYDIVPLGAKVVFHGKEMIIGEIKRSLQQGILLNQYTLFYKEGLIKAVATVDRWRRREQILVSLFYGSSF